MRRIRKQEQMLIIFMGYMFFLIMKQTKFTILHKEQPGIIIGEPVMLSRITLCLIPSVKV